MAEFRSFHAASLKMNKTSLTLSSGHARQTEQHPVSPKYTAPCASRTHWVSLRAAIASEIYGYEDKSEQGTSI